MYSLVILLSTHLGANMDCEPPSPMFCKHHVNIKIAMDQHGPTWPDLSAECGREKASEKQVAG